MRSRNWHHRRCVDADPEGGTVSRVRVLLADDHRIVAEGLKSLLVAEFDLIGVVEDGRAMVAAAKALKPDVIVADITMPHLNGIEALEEVKKFDPIVRVIFLTMHRDPAYARHAFEAGAVGFVLKHSAPEELVLAVRGGGAWAHVHYAIAGGRGAAGAEARSTRGGRILSRP